MPNALVQASDGNLWGTTFSTYPLNGGKVYTITTDGTLLQATALTISSTGIVPAAPLIQGIDGKLYGTASAWGPGGYGTVFVVDAGLNPPSAAAREWLQLSPRR